MRVLPKYLQVPAGAPRRFYPWDEWSRLSSLVGISGAGAHSGLALCIFHSLCSVHLGTICEGKNILQDPVFSRLCASWRVEIPGRKRKERIKKVLDCFSSANCSLRQVIVVKKHTHKYSDSSLTKDQDIGIYSSVSSSQACLLISGSSTSANVFCFIESQTSGGVTGPKRVK